MCRKWGYQRTGIAEGGIFKVRPPDSKIDEDDKRTIAHCGYVCPAFSNTNVGSSFIVMLVKKDNENLISRLSNYKFKSALEHLDGEDEKVRITVEALANTFENSGWFDGSMGEIVDAAVTLLIGSE